MRSSLCSEIFWRCAISSISLLPNIPQSFWASRSNQLRHTGRPLLQKSQLNVNAGKLFLRLKGGHRGPFHQLFFFFLIFFFTIYYWIIYFLFTSLYIIDNVDYQAQIRLYVESWVKYWITWSILMCYHDMCSMLSDLCAPLEGSDMWEGKPTWRGIHPEIMAFSIKQPCSDWEETEISQTCSWHHNPNGWYSTRSHFVFKNLTVI